MKTQLDVGLVRLDQSLCERLLSAEFSLEIVDALYLPLGWFRSSPLKPQIDLGCVSKLGGP